MEMRRCRQTRSMTTAPVLDSEIPRHLSVERTGAQRHHRPLVKTATRSSMSADGADEHGHRSDCALLRAITRDVDVHVPAPVHRRLRELIGQRMAGPGLEAASTDPEVRGKYDSTRAQHSPRALLYRKWLRFLHGGLASTGKAADLKSAWAQALSGFESPALRHFPPTLARDIVPGHGGAMVPGLLIVSVYRPDV